MLFLVIAVVAGIIAGISPCILPVLPIIFFTGTFAGDEAPSSLRHRVRGHLVTIVGLVASFSFIVLFGGEVLSLAHLPVTLLHDAGIGMLALLGCGFLIPRLGDILERPFARLARGGPGTTTNRLLIGIALGFVFVPCAGPILATITILGATNKVSAATVVTTLAFASGVALPLVLIALAGQRVTERLRWMRQHAPLVRRIGGVVMVVCALGFATNGFAGIQRAVPGYTSALEHDIEGTTFVHQALNSLKGLGPTPLRSCPTGTSGLVQCGAAPDFRGIDQWLNTPGDRSISMASLRGHVVLVDFWTYTCINCQRTLPHLEAWYQRYHAAGFDIIGVHTPEFSFEHVASNVRTAARLLGVKYPIAIDNNDATWNAYDNEYWPAEFLIDAQGQVRHVDDGEGGYTVTENLIRHLLLVAHPHLTLGPLTNVANRTPTAAISPETYLGTDRSQFLISSTSPATGETQTYLLQGALTTPDYSLGGTWTSNAQDIEAVAHAQLQLSYVAHDIYLVLGGHGVVNVVPGDGVAPYRLRVSGIPRLYTLVSSGSIHNGVLTLSLSPGVDAYDFTFG